MRCMNSVTQGPSPFSVFANGPFGPTDSLSARKDPPCPLYPQQLQYTLTLRHPLPGRLTGREQGARNFLRPAVTYMRVLMLPLLVVSVKCSTQSTTKSVSSVTASSADRRNDRSS